MEHIVPLLYSFIHLFIPQSVLKRVHILLFTACDLMIFILISSLFSSPLRSYSSCFIHINLLKSFVILVVVVKYIPICNSLSIYGFI